MTLLLRTGDRVPTLPVDLESVWMLHRDAPNDELLALVQELVLDSLPGPRSTALPQA